MALRSASYSAFGECLAQYLAKNGISPNAFAKRVDIQATFLTKIMTGASPVPQARIDAWADALNLCGKDRERFLDHAWLTHCPPYIVELVVRLRKSLK